jgi:hypothetical protein
VNAEWTVAEVRSVAAEFAAIDDATIQAAANQAALLVSPAAFGERLNWAGSLMTAHLLALFPPAGVAVAATAPGPVVSRTVGSVSVTYAAPVTSGTVGLTLGETKYGRMFARLVTLSCSGGVVL